MIYECGPESDRRTVDITIPYANSKIGVFVSGGLDSALLYYLLQKNNHELNNNLIPIVVIKKGSNLDQVKKLLNFLQANDPLVYYAYGSSNGLLLMQSVIKQIYQFRTFKQVYLGVIDELPEFLQGWEPHRFVNNNWAVGPMAHLNKSHTIDLVNQLGLTKLFELTHSCAEQSIGRCQVCNRCRERAWGFEQMSLIDYGTI